MKTLPALLRLLGTHAAFLTLAISASAQTSKNGTAAVSPQSSNFLFSNPAPITINDNTIAAPYPSNITVSGLTTVTRVQVALTGFSHTFPDDVDIVLVGPGGRRTMLMSDAGGGNPGVTNITLTFSAAATNVLPDIAPLTGGTFRPANYDAVDNFPPPGPGALTSEPADLSVFNLTNPNGVWSLYVVDDAGTDVGSIAGGWELLLTQAVVFTVNSAADTSDGTCDAANCTLREAIAAAGAFDLINFSPLFNTPQTINLLTALPDIATSVTIQGPGANLLTVRRDYNAANFRIFRIASGVAGGVAISGMTITGGRSFVVGGGILSQSPLTLTNVHVTGNQANDGGGVGLSSADGVFTGCTFSGNTTTASGSGIFFGGGGNHTLRVVASTVSGNSSSGLDGGGITNFSSNADSRLEVTGCTIANNSAAGTGGGIFTVTQLGSTATATTTLRNTIVALNTPNNLATQASGGTATVTTGGFNLSDNYNGVFAPLGTDITSATPRLGPLSLGGGTTPTHALLGGSPALDAGDASGLTVDQRGQPRVFGASADIGAVEMRPLTVSSTADTGAASLRQAISDANTNGTGLDDIVFSSTFDAPQTISLLTGELAINSSLTINGPGANLLTVRRPPSVADFRIFNIGAGQNVAFSGMTITGGIAIGNGGGISSSSNLTLTNVHVTGNQADNGGGVILTVADGVFTGCTFSGNAATSTNNGGGGIFYGGNGGHTLRLVSSTVSGNTASHGGGILNSVNGSIGQISINDSTIANNSASSTGGGIETRVANSGNATVTLRNTIIASNTPTNLNAGIAGGGTATFITNGFNLTNDSGGGFLNVAPITTDKINAFAGLSPLALNGGTTPTHLLLFGSAAIDAGNNTGSGQTTDQRGGGVRRTVDLPGIANAPGSDGTDIGAVELAGGPLMITSIVRLPNGHILLQGRSEPGSLTIQAATDPNAASFSNLMPPATADVTGFWQYDDAGAIGQTKRFYRATLP